MTFDELKQKMEEEGLGEYVNVRFDTFGGGYNSVCIARADDAFTVNFCDERGFPFAEHPGLSEEDACEMVYSFAIAEKRIRKSLKKGPGSESPDARSLRVPYCIVYFWLLFELHPLRYHIHPPKGQSLYYIYHILPVYLN